MERTFFIALVVLFIVAGNKLDVPHEQINFFFALIMLICEVVATSLFNKETATGKIFKIQTYEWLGAFAITVFLLYGFTAGEWNAWNIMSVLLIISFGFLYSSRNKSIAYSIREDTIKDLHRKKDIILEEVNSINIKDEEIAINTKQFVNELVIKRDQLISPDWDDLKLEFEKLKQQVEGDDSSTE